MGQEGEPIDYGGGISCKILEGARENIMSAIKDRAAKPLGSPSAASSQASKICAAEVVW